MSDTRLLPSLRRRTDQLLENLGVPGSDGDYRYIYAGMYSGVWRDVLIEAEVQPVDLLTVIYEPTKHFAPEDRNEIAAFRVAMKQTSPFLGPGINEKVGLLGYWEPRDPNGRQFRKTVPVALMPNSQNFASFDFRRFPVVPKISNRLPDVSEFDFVDSLSTCRLERNPAYLWALVYPPTPRTLELMNIMNSLKDEVSARNRLADGTSRSNSSPEMAQIGAQVIAELQRINRVMFEGLS